MKRYLLLLTPFVLVLTMALSGCSLDELSRESELQAAAETTYEELSSTFSSDSGQFSLVTEYLVSWANKNDITIDRSAEHYMVLSNPATAGFESSDTTVLQCGVDTNEFSTSMQPLTTGLTALLGPENHGRISLIVTEINNGEFVGASAVDKKYLECDDFINLDHSSDVNLYTAGAYEMTGVMSTDIHTDTPSYSHAFAITMSISGYHDPFDFNDHYPNPVETIGNLLATEKSSGQLFSLASFECESVNGYTPTSATAIVIVDGNDVENFTRRFNTSYNNMKDRFEDLNDNFVYTLTETTMPETVMSSQTSDNIISLMYTLQSGIYLQDEEDGSVLAASDISSISTSGGKFRLTTVLRSTDKAILNEMSDEFLTTSGLCSISYTVSDPVMTWTSDTSKGAAYFLKDALGTDEAIVPFSLESDECCVFAARADIDIASYRYDRSHMDVALTNIVNFLDDLTQ